MLKLEKRTEPIINITPAEREQRLLEMKSELDELDFEIAKNERKDKLRKQTNLGKKFKDALDDIGTALDGFGDMGLNKTNIESNPKKIKSIDRLASFD